LLHITLQALVGPRYAVVLENDCGVRF